MPQYVSHTEGIPSQYVGSLAALRLGAHLDVAAGRWTHTPRSERVCALCGDGVGDEYHMLLECSAHTVPRQMHADLCANVGGLAFLHACRLFEQTACVSS
jgi:hypothetical protein